MQLDKYEYENLVGELNDLMMAQDAFTAASIDAACTRSSIDRRTRKEKEERLDTLRNAFEAKLKAAIK